MKAGKYEIRGEIINTQTGQPVAADMPIFLLLGSDFHAPYAIAEYAQRCNSEKQQEECFLIAQQFGQWQQENPDRVHEPDGRE